MTDLTTAIETASAARAANPAPQPDPVTIDLANTRRVAKASVVFHAYMEDSDMWDGWAMYADLPTALQTAASDYVDGEYGDQDDPETDRPGVLVWSMAYGSWHLSDGGKDTLVRVTETAVYAPEEG